MNRLWWRLLAWSMLLPLLAAMYLPITERGSQFALAGVTRVLPLEIEYGGGTLAGQLQLSRVAWSNDRIVVELQDLHLELSPACLWRSAICFTQLYASQLDITLISTSDDEIDLPETDGERSLFVFPLPMEAANLQVDALRVQWEGGQWHQGTIEGAVKIRESTVRVGRAFLQNAMLTLSGSSEDNKPFLPPTIKLPLELAIEELVLIAGGWDLNGESGTIDSLRLSGNWRKEKLDLQGLHVRSKSVGQWEVEGGIEFSGNWPLTLSSEVLLPVLADWPEPLDRTFSVKTGGNLAALAWEAGVGGRVTLSGRGTINILSPQLPFQLSGSADWAGTLALSEVVQLPESLASVMFSAPLQLSGSGDIDAQVFQLESTVSGLGYETLGLRLAGRHANERLTLEDIRLQDEDAGNTVWATAELDYEEGLQWSTVIETSGLDLLPLQEYGAARIEGGVEGRIEGRMQLLGSLAADTWNVSVADARLSGELNDMPLLISGYAGIDNQLRLLPSDLQAELNGARLLLRRPVEETGQVRLDISVQDLSRWLPDASGNLSLQATIKPGWENFEITGSLSGIDWQGLQIASGAIDGNYRPAGDGDMRLDLNLAELVMSDIEVSSMEMSLRGTSSAQTLSLRSQGDVQGLLQVAGRSSADGVWSGQLAPTTVQTPFGNWYLGESVAMEYSREKESLRLAAHCWQIDSMQVCPGEAVLARQGNASLSLDGDLTTFAGFLPVELALEGRATAQLAASWSAEQPLTLDGTAQGSDIVLTRSFVAGESGSVSWQKITGDIHRGADGLSVTARADDSGSRIIELALTLPTQRGMPLSGSLDIEGLQLDTLLPFVPTFSQLQGKLSGSLRLAGTVNEPAASGELRLTGGDFALLGNPTQLQQLELQLTALGDRAKLRGSGLLGGGRVSLDGEILTRPDWHLQLAIEGGKHEILLPPYTQMLVSEQLQMTLRDDLLHVQGKIQVHEGLLEHEQLPAGGVSLSDDVVEVDVTGNVIYQRAPFDISMNVGLLIEDKFRLEGEVVNATLGGDLQLRQEPRQPFQVFGNLNVIGGELRAYQQYLKIKRGTISFAGAPKNPELNVRAQRRISTDNVIVGLQMQGTLEQPRLDVFSEPVLSHGEAMSYLVRGRALDAGASSDGVAMALSLGTGLVNQSAMVTELNRIPGVSNLSFGAEGTTEEDTAATVGGYLGERLYLSWGMGVYEPIYVLTARLYLQSRLWLEVVSRLENSVDLYYSFDIK